MPLLSVLGVGVSSIGAVGNAMANGMRRSLIIWRNSASSIEVYDRPCAFNMLDTSCFKSSLMRTCRFTVFIMPPIYGRHVKTIAYRN